MARINVIIRELSGEKITHEQSNNIGAGRTLEQFQKLSPNQFNRELALLADRTVHRKYGPNSAFFKMGNPLNGYALAGKVAKKSWGLERFYDESEATTVNVCFIAEDGTKLTFRSEKAA